MDHGLLSCHTNLGEYFRKFVILSDGRIISEVQWFLLPHESCTSKIKAAEASYDIICKLKFNISLTKKFHVSMGLLCSKTMSYSIEISFKFAINTFGMIKFSTLDMIWGNNHMDSFLNIFDLFPSWIILISSESEKKKCLKHIPCAVWCLNTKLGISRIESNLGIFLTNSGHFYPIIFKLRFGFIGFVEKS